MGIRDIEDFLFERAAQFDPTMDLSSGAPFDVQVVQPLMRRIGVDPFSVDIETFLDTRINQAFPELATKSGDAVADLLVKPAALLWDAVIREVVRVQRNLSFRDPATLNTEEAEALGANIFAQRRTGDFARGQGRIFFSQPQNITVSPVNYATSRAGLRFFPTEVQTIRTEEMALNQADDGTYYFDVNFRAENAGDEYNIGFNELVQIASVEAAVRVTNLKRFRYGEPEDTAEEFVDQARSQLSERSLVTLRGITSKLGDAFPELRRMNVVGAGDPEMNRDIVTGGGLGEILATGIAGFIADDEENQAASRRFSIDDAVDVDISFLILIGSASIEPSGYVLSIVEGVDDPAAVPIQDFDVTRVVDATTVEIGEQVLGFNRTDLRWSLRKRELTLSGIPGGILFPDSAHGTVSIEDGAVHIGGATDIFVNETAFEEATLTLDNVTDDTVELSGTEAQPNSLSAFGGSITFDGVQLADFVLGTDYQVNSTIFRLLERAQKRNLTLQLVTGEPGHDPTNLGVYRVVRVAQESGQPAKLQVEPTPAVLDGLNYTWRLFDEVNVDLVDPKETRISDVDLQTVQNSNLVTTGASTNFGELGVAEDDVLRILDGPDAGDYVIDAVLGAGFDQLQISAKLRNTASDLQYIVFRPNSAGGIELPLIRVSSIELLDSAFQPLGSLIPYAKPIDIQSRAFQNPARGVKHTLSDAQLGIISVAADGFGNFPGLTGRSLSARVFNRDGTSTSVPIGPFVSDSLAAAVALMNAALAVPTGSDYTVFPYGTDKLAVRPARAGISFEAGNARATLFGADEPFTTADIRSAYVDGQGGWDALSPAVDYRTGLDVVQVISGNQVGFYSAPYSGPASTQRPYAGTAVNPTTALIVRNTDIATDEDTIQFAPEENVRLQLGSRSLGSVRCYFLEPTTIESVAQRHQVE
jgi:hypothetical protein